MKCQHLFFFWKKNQKKKKKKRNHLLPAEFVQRVVKVKLFLLASYNINTLEFSATIFGLGGSVGCPVRLETRRSRVHPPPRSATFFRGD